ncbi:MAG: hypothetical protein COA94_00535 [Rickettsiales bacterium]|nr:MAG: hypothetical protein COA94_00535 [Rickettsiales bacterium]
MILQREKICAIISDNSIISSAICENTTCQIDVVSSDYESFIDSKNKLDLLILDKDIYPHKLPLHRINCLINLTDQKFSDSEIRIAKPLKLYDLLGIIASNMREEYFFCCINHEWIYHERRARFISASREISLTDKENALVARLLSDKNFSAKKDSLKTSLWNYHQDSESTTVDTHLYKLKQKLPAGMVEIRQSECLFKFEKVVF